MVKTQVIPLTREEMKALIDAAREDDFYYMFFMVAKTTGRRLGEYYGVQVKDIKVDTDGSKTMMTEILKRRMRYKKEAILTDEVYHIIRDYIFKYKLKSEDFLFQKHSYRHIQNRVAFYAKKAGIKHVVSPHSFRHWVVSELLKQGWSYDKISKITAHSTPQTIMHYDHVQSKDIKNDALKALKEME